MKIAAHSFRGGTGKSNTAANLAAILALRGKRVGIIDLDLLAPGLHVLFNVPKEALKWTLNDFLWERCKVKDIVIDITDMLQIKNGKLFFVPASIKAEDVLRIIRTGYEVSMFSDGIDNIIKEFNLDYLWIDTHPGIHEDTLLAIATCETVLTVMRLDKQDYTGTAITLELTRRFGKKLYLLINMVPHGVPEGYIKKEVEQTYGESVLGVIPFSEDLMAVRSGEVFCLKHPDHPYTKVINSIVDKLLEATP
jgi:MinD-like ATPase involved in chromosome partitioning or flagellar assembly